MGILKCKSKPCRGGCLTPVMRMRNVLSFEILTSEFSYLPKISERHEEQLLMCIGLKPLKLKYLLSDANIHL